MLRGAQIGATGGEIAPQLGGAEFAGKLGAAHAVKLAGAVGIQAFEGLPVGNGLPVIARCGVVGIFGCGVGQTGGGAVPIEICAAGADQQRGEGCEGATHNGNLPLRAQAGKREVRA